MKMLISIFFALVLCVSSYGQDSEIEAINKDVWFNFMQAYQDLDASLFNQIHTNEVLRVMADNNRMLIGQEYKDTNLEMFNRWNAGKIKQKIEFSFLSRTQKENWAYEIGIFKLTRFNGKEENSFYGKFNVTLKKVNGVWKIHIDSDTSEGGTISEVDFEKGTKLAF